MPGFHFVIVYVEYYSYDMNNMSLPWVIFRYASKINFYSGFFLHKQFLYYSQVVWNMFSHSNVSHDLEINLKLIFSVLIEFHPLIVMSCACFQGRNRAQNFILKV